MFDKHFHVGNVEDHSVQAANILAKSNENFAKMLSNITQNEIKSKDRVDISLAEYENLKNELSTLRDENRYLKIMLHEIGIPAEIIDRIIPTSIHVERCDDFREFKIHYRVNFSVDDAPDIRKRRML